MVPDPTQPAPRKERKILRMPCPHCKTPLNVVAGTFWSCPLCGEHGIAPEDGAPATTTPQAGADLPAAS